MLEAVIFDLDGVITDTAEYHYKAWKNLAENIGVKINRDFNERLKGISRMDSLNEILEYGNVTQSYTEQQKIKMADEKNEEYKKLLNNLRPTDIYPGIKELLDDLKARNIKLALASASENGPAILNKLEISDYFGVVVDPARIKNGKPAPDIFLKAAHDLNAKATNCIGIEDAKAGIKAIKRAGMFAVGVGRAEVMESAGADLIFGDTKEMTIESLLEAFEQ